MWSLSGTADPPQSFSDSNTDLGIKDASLERQCKVDKEGQAIALVLKWLGFYFFALNVFALLKTGSEPCSICCLKG